VLTEVDELGIRTIVSGGDVAAGPMPAETLDLLRDRGALFVRGNADRLRDLAGGEAPARETCGGRQTSWAPSAFPFWPRCRST